MAGARERERERDRAVDRRRDRRSLESLQREENKLRERGQRGTGRAPEMSFTATSPAQLHGERKLG